VERSGRERLKELGEGIVTSTDDDDARTFESRKRNEALKVGNNLSNRERKDERGNRGRGGAQREKYAGRRQRLHDATVGGEEIVELGPDLRRADKEHPGNRPADHGAGESFFRAPSRSASAGVDVGPSSSPRAAEKRRSKASPPSFKKPAA
jgi:hypothetical protein